MIHEIGCGIARCMIRARETLDHSARSAIHPDASQLAWCRWSWPSGSLIRNHQAPLTEATTSFPDRARKRTR